MLENLLGLAPLLSQLRGNAERLAARLVTALILIGISIALAAAAIGFAAFALDRALVSGVGESGAAAITAGILAVIALIGWRLAWRSGRSKTTPPSAELESTTVLAIVALLGGIAASTFLKRRD